MTPTATYRLQIRPDFDLAAATGLVDYLAGLGVTHLYSAPLLQAAPGSSHGYDVADHSRVNDELGGAEALEKLVTTLRRHQMGLVVDIVPNHAGVREPRANPAWWDLLRHGRDSAYASWFDVDWSLGKLRLPLLGDDAALSAVTVAGDTLQAGGRQLPLAPGSSDGTGGDVERLHARQHYELIRGSRADRELNYRRFFAVSDLAALRVEDPEVFAATHAEVLRWYERGYLDGIRIDHPDGLRDPGGYLRRLHEAAPRAWLVVEKILEPGEELPAWPVAGTTGYDALREITAVLLDPDAEAAFTALDAEVTGVATDWPALVRRCKLQVSETILGSELARLVRLAVATPGGDPGAESGGDPGGGQAAATDPDPAALREALAELLADLDVYRTYLPGDPAPLVAAAAAARRHRPDLATTIDSLLPRLLDGADELAIRFQQSSGAVMAKGVEDTALYRWNRMVALNEVGGDPVEFGAAPERFHQACQRRLRQWPASMTTLSTHDTKRSEDVRARLAVLTEIPATWGATLRRWMAAAPLPDAAMAQLLWQTVAGSWPIERDRLHDYLTKATREAGTATSWGAPDAGFEDALRTAVQRCYDEPGLRGQIEEFTALITPYGWSNSLSAKLVQLTAPGVPDVYQGSELWDNSLVDPDNRRPVDFDARRALLARLDAGWLPPVDAGGAVKLLTVAAALRCRRDHPEWFTGYTPVAANGAAAQHLLGFDRGGAITLATRLPLRLQRRGGWGGTLVRVPFAAVDRIGGTVVEAGEVEVASLLHRYPVALLTPA